MNTTLAKFMSLAVTAVVIVALLYDKLVGVFGEFADKVAIFISSH